MSLTQIGIKYGTDKASVHKFTDFYDSYLNPRKNELLNILEIGIDNGCSLAMWKEYLPNSAIYAIDIQPKFQYKSNNVFIAQGDQGDSNFLQNVFPGVKFDFIIDDGSHYISHQLISLRTLFSRLKSNGLYAIEDLHTSYTQRKIVNVTGEPWIFEYGGHYGSPIDYTTLKVIEDLESSKYYNYNPYLPVDQYNYIKSNVSQVKLHRTSDVPPGFKWEDKYDSITSMLVKK